MAVLALELMAIEMCTESFERRNFFVGQYKHTMATIFSAPEIGDPRATGIKNGGVTSFGADIVYPTSRLTTPDGTWSGGKQLEFRWRSDSSRFWSPRDTKLYVKYKVGFGPKAGETDGAAQNLATAAGVDAVKNVRITAAPNTSLFDGGVRYLQNSVVVENQTEPLLGGQVWLTCFQTPHRVGHMLLVRAERPRHVQIVRTTSSRQCPSRGLGYLACTRGSSAALAHTLLLPLLS